MPLKTQAKAFRRKLLTAGILAAALPLAGTMQETAPTGTTKRSVLALTPCLVFEKLKDESPLDPGKFGGTALGEELSAVGAEHLGSKGFGIISVANLPSEAAPMIARLQPLAGRLARGSLTDSTRATLAEFASRTGPALILAQYLRVRVGEGGYVGPSLTGSISSGQYETLLAAALIEPVEGKVVWKNETLVRKVLKPGSKDLEKALSTLYGTF